MDTKAPRCTAWLGVTCAAVGHRGDAAQPPVLAVGVFDTGVSAAAPLTGDAVAQEIRSRTQAMLRNPTGYEAPRH
jgi:hypothetical protein